MTKLLWDQVGQRTYETGVDHGVLYLPDNTGVYDSGYAWNGLVTVTESPSGAEANAQYADNIKYLNIQSAEEFGGTIEAFTYPAEFAVCDGSAMVEGGIAIAQQARRSFGFAYRTIIGNDVVGNAFGYKLHLVYGATVAPSERAYGTVNDSPEPITFSWEFSTTPVPIGEVGEVEYKPSSTITLDSTQLDADTLSDLEDILYGTSGSDPRLPLPAEVIAMFAGTVVEAVPTVPTYNSTTKVITIPTVAGIQYTIDGAVRAAGAQPAITKNTIVRARTLPGYTVPADTDVDWQYNF